MAIHTIEIIFGLLVAVAVLAPPFIIRWLRVQDDGVTEKEKLRARVSAVQAALVRINDFKGKSDELVLGRLRFEYENRIRELESGGMTADHVTHIPQARTHELLSEEASQ